MIRESIRLAVTAFMLCIACMAHGEIEWLETRHNFGTFDEDMGKVSCKMRFVNRGTADVIIEAVRPTCGCTAGDYPKNAIAPGDTAAITLTYNPYARPGKFSKDVYVIVNATPHRSKLTVEGNVIGAANTILSQYPHEVGNMKFNRLLVPFGEIVKGNVPSQLIKGYNMSRDSMLISFQSLPQHIKAIAVPERVGPSDLCTISLYYESPRQAVWGFADDEMTLVATDLATGTSAKAKVETTAIISDDFSRLTESEIASAPMIKIAEPRINLGTVAYGKKAKCSFTISNNGINPLDVRRIYWSGAGIKASPLKCTVKKGKQLKVQVTIDTSQYTGKVINTKIMIISNDPHSPTTAVRIVGEIK